MIIKKADLAAVAVKASQYPPDDMPEIAFAGRSNVGKSSLINKLVNRRGFARVSGSPGKTRTINFYQIDDRFRIVDLPGYGYAKVSKSISKDWGAMIEAYLAGRPNLVRVVQLLDIRHEPTGQDIQMYEWIRHYGLDGLLVATKADKISGSERNRCLATIRKTLKLTETDRIIPVSSLKRTGIDELLDELGDILEG